MKSSVFALFILFCLSCATPGAKQTADLLLLNGQFFTADSTEGVTALAIRGDRIVYVGDETGARALAGDSTKVIDLQGAFAMPGLIDGHGHFNALGQSVVNLNFLNTTSWQQVLDQTAERASTTTAGQWIEGRGWHQEKWTESVAGSVGGYPRHDALSARTPNHPVVLGHASGHALLANARAMELAGVSRETSDPEGGRILRDASGKPTGVFEENAMSLIDKPLTDWKNKRSEAEKQAEFDETAKRAAEACLQLGITSFQDAGSNFWELEQYRRLAENGKLPMRLWAMAKRPQAHEMDKLKSFPQIGAGNGHFTCRAVKAYADGALGSYGAWLLEPYSDRPELSGQLVTPLDTLSLVAERCAQLGLQYCVHAIGDRANREVLNIMAARKPEGKRWRMEHAQHVHPDDIPRFAQLGVVASMQAIHCTSDAPFVPKRLGMDRARTGAYVWRSLIDSGAHLANGTDAPVEDVAPLPNLFASVTRRRPGGPEAFFPEQAMTRREALLSYTIWNAWAAFEENEKGMLKSGYLADIAVFSKNLLTCTEEEMLEAKVVYTIVGGKIAVSRQ